MFIGKSTFFNPFFGLIQGYIYFNIFFLKRKEY